MIGSVPPGWKQHSGLQVWLLEAPDNLGRIRIHPRLPLEPVSRSINRIFVDASGWVLDDACAIVTAEGELGVFCRITVQDQGASHLRFVGVLFGDETSSVVDGKPFREPGEALVERTTRDVVSEFSLGLGVRRRRYRYQPPLAWQPIPTGLTTTWYPPGFPNDHAQIVVFPAEPTSKDPQEELEDLLAVDRARGMTVEGAIERVRVETSKGLVGDLWSFAQRGAERVVYRELAMFVRAPYRYAVKLDGIDHRHEATFRAIVDSIMPCPHAGHLATPHSRNTVAAVGHWTD